MIRRVSLQILSLFLIPAAIHLSLPLYAQETVYFEDDFNACELGAGWEVEMQGDTLPAWEIGIPSNPKADSQSIDGSCMLVIDDDLHGQNATPTITTFRTPSFDATQHRETYLEADIHFRPYENSTFSVLVWDGQAYQLLRTFDVSSGTGNTFAKFERVRVELSFYANADMHVAFVYDDGGTWAWWAGVDNLMIYGEGSGDFLSTEDFNACELPAGWETEIVAGDDDWQFGYVDNSKAYASNSMNGSCFAYFDDDGIGQDAAPSIVRLYSPEIDGTIFADLFLEFDIILRTYAELEGLTILLELDGEEVALQTWLDDIGGPQFNAYERLVIDLSRYRARTMRVIFEYTDGGEWGWWVGLDDIRIWGTGEINDLCEKAIAIQAGGDCIAGNNEKSISEDIDNGCQADFSHSLWYRYQAEESGMVRLSTSAAFNDGVIVYTGDCSGLEDMSCHNEDEHGFEGEDLYFTVETGSEYFIRVCGVYAEFGNPTGDLCLHLSKVPAAPEPPLNDLCENAIEIEEGTDCAMTENIYAGFEGPEPALNRRSRHDVWFRFESPGKGRYRFLSNADFTDVITLYSGDCGAAEEWASSDTGYDLIAELPGDVSVLLQVSGYFSTIEGGYCLQVERMDDSLSTNNHCTEAQWLEPGGTAASGDNAYASGTGVYPTCSYGAGRDLWYRFEAPESEGIRYWVEGDFPHTVAIYEGNCQDGLEEVYCSGPLDRCMGYLEVPHLEPGQEYFLQLLSSDHQFGTLSGAFALHLEDIDDQDSYTPLLMNAEAVCVETGKAVLQLDLSGGMGGIEILGRQSGDTLYTGQKYLCVATDEAGCVESASGLISCGGAYYGCDSYAGEMDQQQVYLCEQETFTAGHAGGQVFDSDDTYEYILFSGSCNEIDELIDRNKDGVFEYVQGMLYGHTYYVTYIVGNEGIGGKVDTRDSCLSIACGQPVVFYKSPSPFAGEDATVCGLQFETSAEASVGDGEWSLVEGPSADIAIGDPNQPVSFIEVPEYGTYTFRWKEANFGCEEEDWVTVEFVEGPQSFAGDNRNICGLEGELAAVPSLGEGEWTIDEGPGTISLDDPSDPVSGIQVDQYGLYTLRWSEEHLGCTDEVQVEIRFVEEPDANAGPDENVCDMSYTLQAIPSAGEGLWTLVDGPGQLTFANDIDPGSGVTFGTTGSYLLEWSEDNFGCTDVDEVRIQVWDAFSVGGDTTFIESPNGEEYTISFDLTGGFGQYTVTSQNGSIVDGTFISDPVSCGEDYEFILSDQVCGELRVAGAYECDPTATIDPVLDAGLRLFPVPVGDILYLEFISVPGDAVSVRILDQLGKSASYRQDEVMIQGEPVRLDVRALPSGLYYLEVSGPEGVAIRKFVKK